MKVIVIGSLNKDIVFEVESIVNEGQTISSKTQSEYIGGKGFNQSVALSYAYPNVYYYCNLNKNDKYIEYQMKKYNFKKDYIQKIEEPTGIAFIQVNKNGENAIVISKNANNCIDFDHVKNILEDFNKDDLVLLQNEINDVEKIIDLCQEKGISVALNPSPVEGITMDLVSKVKYLIANLEEFLSITRCTDLEQGIKVFRKGNLDTQLIITLGKEGALYNYKKTVKAIGIETNAVDTTCAGDTFLGYFLGSLLNGLSVEESLDKANLAASLCIQKKGASNSIPTLNEVIKRND